MEGTVQSIPGVQAGTGNNSLPQPQVVYQTTQQSSKKWWVWPLVTIIVVLIMCCSCSGVCYLMVELIKAAPDTTTSLDDELSYDYVYGDENSKNKILSIKINGTILNEDPDESSWFEDTDVVYGYSIKEELYRAAEDDTIKGILFEISSPGGTVTGSKAIADGVAYYKAKTGNPVIAYGQGTVASGGYWVAASADYIILDQGSIIGSIGVIFGPFEYYDKVTAIDGGLLSGGIVTQNGIEYTYITAGDSKDLGNPFRRMTQEEVAVLQTGVNNEYADFITHVSEGRGIDEVTIKTQIKALIYDNVQAESLGLIDETLNREDAFDRTAEKCDLSVSDYQIVRKSDTYDDFWDEFWSVNFGSDQSSDASDENIVNGILYVNGLPWYESQYLAFYGDPTKVVFESVE